ncbi:hypothetical protein BCV70DRAFT_75963 [Testicularia cyperi]|uniref:Uncharacterized protein n=1 Tax=Testicularia cyperi TaxID=1882483 RepID=A0A317XW02_9BASI|nr:hypothetical protein BCV70DRAFT_75963 [Testicularia cyperi]
MTTAEARQTTRCTVYCNTASTLLYCTVLYCTVLYSTRVFLKPKQTQLPTVPVLHSSAVQYSTVQNKTVQ